MADGTNLAPLEEILAAIVSIVRGSYAAGKPATGAHVNNVLLRSDPGFSPHRYGFERLGDLLRRGHDEGHFVYVPGSPDRLYPVGVSPDSAAVRHDAAPTYRVRRDLWQAFVRDDGVQRSYDRETDQVVLGCGDGQRAIEIQPISAETQKSWLRKRLESEPTVEQELIERLLSSPKWFAEVARPGALPPPVNESWRRERGVRIYGEISKWLAKHALSMNLREQEPEGYEHGGQGRPATGRLRFAMLRAISKMPTHELLRLPIPLIYFDASVLADGRSPDIR